MNMPLKTICFSVLLFLSFLNVHAQSFEKIKQRLEEHSFSYEQERAQVDSLLQVYELTNSDTQKIHLLFDIEYELYPYYIALDKLVLTHIVNECRARLKQSLSEQEIRFYKWNLAMALRFMGNNADYQGKLDSAVYYCKQSLNLFEALNDTSEMANCLNDWANVIYETGDYGVSVKLYLKSLKLREAMSERSEYTIRTLLNIGATYEMMEQPDLNVEYLNQAKNMAIELNMPEELPGIYSAIGGAYSNLNEFDVALSYYAKVQDLLNENGDISEQALLYMKYANVYKEIEKPYIAIAYYDSSYNYMLANNYDSFIGDVLNNKSLTYKDLGKLQESEESVKQAIAFYKTKDDKVGLAGAYANYGEVINLKGKPAKALAILRLAEQTIIETTNIEFKRNIYFKLSSLLSKLNQDKKALDAYKKYVELDKQIREGDKQKILWKYQYQSEYEAQAREDSLRHEQAMQLAAIELSNTQFKNNMLSAIAVGLGVLALLIILWLRTRAQKRLEERNAKVKAEVVKAMIVGQEKERSRISRELHDGVGADLIAAKFKLNEQQHTPGYQILANTISNIRNFSHELIPPRLDLHSIEEYLAEYVNALRDDVPFTIQYHYIGNFSALNIDEKIALYRMTQESITNIIKHAEASEVIIQLTEENRNITLLIEDDGVGFEADEQTDGIGLANIKSRLDMLKGSLQIDSSPGRGTTILVQFTIGAHLLN